MKHRSLFLCFRGSRKEVEVDGHPHRLLLCMRGISTRWDSCHLGMGASRVTVPRALPPLAGALHDMCEDKLGELLTSNFDIYIFLAYSSINVRDMYVLENVGR